MRNIIRFFAAPILLSAMAAQSAELQICMAIKTPQAKLDCYAAFAQVSGAQSQPPSDKGQGDRSGDWRISTDINPLDDTETFNATLFAKNDEMSAAPRVSLTLRCKSRVLEAFVNWNDYLGSEVYVTSRVGSSVSERRLWGISTDSKASFHPSPRNFLQELIGEDRLVAQVIPYNESPVTAIFSLAGYDFVGKELRARCPIGDTYDSSEYMNRKSVT